MARKLQSFHLFYLTFPNQNQIQQTVSAKLSWSHFQLIMRVSDSNEFIRNPAVLEFLNIPANYAYTEKQLEQSLIDNLQQFLLELPPLSAH